MGLDMYLYKTTKTRLEKRKKFNEAMNEHYSKWNDFYRNLPRKDNGWEIDDAKLTEQNKKDMDQCQRESDEIKTSLNYNGKEQEYHYWRKFNALHGFIVREFADGVDECQVIEIGNKDGVNKILDALKTTLKQIEDGEKDIENLKMPPTAGFFFGSTEISDWFKDDLKESIPVFQELADNLRDNEVVYYQASW